MHLEMREGKLAEADWYYADLEAAPSTGWLSRFRKGAQDARIQGPVTLAQLQQLASSGRVDRQKTLIWRPHWNQWQAAGEIQVLYAHQSPPPLPLRVSKRGLLFRAVEGVLYFSLTLILSIPLAVLSAFLKVLLFVKQRLGSMFLDEPLAAASVMGLHGQGLPAAGAELGHGVLRRRRLLKVLGGTAILFQALVCLMGVGVLASEMDEEMMIPYAFFWLGNLGVWAAFLHQAWNEIPAKYQPTDQRSMLYWLLVPGLSTFGWIRILPELGQASYRIRHGAPMPNLAYRMSWWATLMCYVPVLNIAGGLILMLWLTGVRRDLKEISNSTQTTWN